MLSSLQNLLSSFFVPYGTAAAQASANPQLATAVLLFDVMRSDDSLSGAERAQALGGNWGQTPIDFLTLSYQ